MPLLLLLLAALVGILERPVPASSSTVVTHAPSAPLLLVPGWADEADKFDTMRERLLERGWEEDAVVAITFDDPVGSNRTHAAEIAEAIEALRARTGAEQVDIVAHSMGGLAVRYYLAENEGFARRVVFLGTPQQGTVMAYLAWGDGGDEMEPESEFLRYLNGEPLPESVQAIVVQTPLDFQVLPAENGVLPGAEHVEVCCPAHWGLLLHDETFELVVRFLETGAVEDGG